MGFVQNVRQSITKMVDKMAAAYQSKYIRGCGHSYLAIFNQISSKFHICNASINLWFKFESEICPTNDNQDGRQNGRRLPVCTCGRSNLVIYHPILFQISYLFL